MNTSAAARIAAQRLWIEEWRNAELGVADSLHHAVLLRIWRLFDSAQTVSREGYAETLREVDAVNRMNDITWAKRRWEVIRQADSAQRTLPVSP